MDANTDDGSCLVIGEACDDNDEDTINDVVTENCECAGEVDAVLEVDFELNVYPNPTMGEVIITLPVGHAFDLTLVSLSGQTVHASQTTKGGPVVWNVEGCQPERTCSTCATSMPRRCAVCSLAGAERPIERFKNPAQVFGLCGVFSCTFSNLPA